MTKLSQVGRTYDLVSDTTAPLAASTTNYKSPIVAWIKVGGEERTRDRQLGRMHNRCHFCFETKVKEDRWMTEGVPRILGGSPNRPCFVSRIRKVYRST